MGGNGGTGDNRSANNVSPTGRRSKASDFWTWTLIIALLALAAGTVARHIF